jgi:hypothetical protein
MRKIKKLLVKIKSIEWSYNALTVRQKLYVGSALVGIIIILIISRINHSLAQTCAEVNSFRGCVAKPGFCRTKTLPCPQGNSCQSANIHKCVPVYYF